MLLCREQRRLRFEQVAHCFDDDEIGACLCARLAHDAERFICRFKRHLSGRGEQLTGRADIQRDAHALSDRFLCDAHGCTDALRRIDAGACKLQRIRAECVCIDDLGAGFCVGFVYRCHARRFGQVQTLRQFTGREMQHGAHAAVQKYKFIQKQCTKIHTYLQSESRKNER